MEEGEPIEAGLISKAIENAQRKVEAHNFDIRKHLLEYDDVMNKHREIIYSLRRKILKGEGIEDIVSDMINDRIDVLIETYTDPKSYPEDWDIQGLMESTIRTFGVRPKINADDIGEEEFNSLKPEILADMLKTQVREANEARMKGIDKNELLRIQKIIMLQIIDNQWLRHLQDMDHLKEGIGLRGYAQQDPLKEYQKDGFELFHELDQRISDEILMTLSRIQLMREKPEELPRHKKRAMQLSHGDSGARMEPVKREGKKIGRNDPCPCGSGKKYKKCCGAEA